MSNVNAVFSTRRVWRMALTLLGLAGCGQGAPVAMPDWTTRLPPGTVQRNWSDSAPGQAMTRVFVARRAALADGASDRLSQSLQLQAPQDLDMAHVQAFVDQALGKGWAASNWQGEGHAASAWQRGEQAVLLVWNQPSQANAHRLIQLAATPAR